MNFDFSLLVLVYASFYECRTEFISNYASYYVICDIIAFPWVFIAKALTVSLEDFPNVFSWRKSIKQRPAVIKAIDLYKEKQNLGDSNVRNNSILFNQSASHILDT